MLSRLSSTMCPGGRCFDHSAVPAKVADLNQVVSSEGRLFRNRLGSAALLFLHHGRGNRSAFLDDALATKPLDGACFLGHRPHDQPLLLQFARLDEYITRWDAAVYEAAAGKPCGVEWFECDHYLNEEACRSRLAWLREQLGAKLPPH